MFKFFINTKSEKRSWQFKFLMLLALIVLGCNASNDETTNNQEKERAKENKIIKEFAAKHGAILDWDKELFSEQGRYLSHFFTADLQKLVTNTKGKSVALKLMVEDIHKDKDRFFVIFKPSERVYYSTEMYFEFECNDVLINKIKSNQKERGLFSGPEFLVIATLKNVYKPKFSITAERGDFENAYLAFGTSDVYKISGQCVGLMSLG
jgi:hypothetical protein